MYWQLTCNFQSPEKADMSSQRMPEGNQFEQENISTI